MGLMLRANIFWDEVGMDGILKKSNVNLVGDLNLTLLAKEVWGSNIRLDPVASFFNNFFSGSWACGCGSSSYVSNME